MTRPHFDVMHIVPKRCARAGTLVIARQNPDSARGISHWFAVGRPSVLQQFPLGALYTMQCAHRARRVG